MTAHPGNAAGATGPTGNTGPTGAGATGNTGPTGNTGSQAPPTFLRPNFERMPPELKQLPNWVLWIARWTGSKWSKRPIQPSGFGANTTNPQHWSSFDQVKQAYERAVKVGYIEVHEKDKPIQRIGLLSARLKAIEADDKFIGGIGFVFDGQPDENGLVLAGVDFDKLISDETALSYAQERIKRLGSYVEASVSGGGLHVIVKALPLPAGIAHGGVELYTSGRFFTMTGKARENARIAAAPDEFAALANELRVKEAATKQQQSSRSGSNGVSNIELPPSFENGPAQAFAALDPQGDNLAEGIQAIPWFEALSPEQKDEVVDYALGFIANNTKILELRANGGDGYAEWFKLAMSVARSSAPSAEDIFVKHASSAKDADPDAALRQYFSSCRTSKPSGSREITVGTLLHLGQQNGASFDQWKCQAPSGPPLPQVTWSPAALKVPFSKIRHRHWLYGTYLIRGELTVEGAPGGAGKTAHATGMAVEIATGKEVLGEKIWGGGDLKSLYINSEDSGVEMWRRIWAFCLAHNIAEPDLDRLYVAGTDDPRLKHLSFLRTVAKATSLDPDGFKQLDGLLDALRPDLVVLDPLVAFCGGADMNDNAVMALVVRELKRLAAKFNSAMLIVHHNRKGGEPGSAEAISGAAAIVNLARRAIMPVPMTEDETKKLGVLPSERFCYIKMIDAKSNFAPRSGDSPWYRLHSVELPNPEPPVYPYGDNVQAIARVHLPLVNSAAATVDDQKIRRAILDLVDRGKMIDGQSYPYSPSLAGAQNTRALLDDAAAAVASATAPRQWPPCDLRAATERAIAKMKEEGLLVEELMPNMGRFRRGRALRVDQSHIPQPDVGSGGSTLFGDPAAPGEDGLQEAKNQGGGQLVNSWSID